MKSFMRLLIGVCLLVIGPMVFADQDNPLLMYQLMENMGDEVWYIIEVVLAISGLVGLILVVHGLHKIKAHPTDTSGTGGFWSKGMTQLIVGGFLFAIPVIGAITGTSLFNSSTTGIPSEGSVFQQVTSNNYNPDSPYPNTGS